MTTTAAVIAQFFSPNRVNVVAAVLTFYLVATGVLTVRRTAPQMRALATAFMLVAVAVGAHALALGAEGVASTTHRIDGVPAPPLFMFGIVALLAAFGDLRMLHAGRIEGARRLARHLWRMSYAMWIATTSAFLGQAKFVPEPLRKLPLLVAPVLLVLVVMIYWLVKVRRRPPAHTRARVVREAV
jgi:peptidoglycan/LPS O-acetylase OafA/YrhL